MKNFSISPNAQFLISVLFGLLTAISKGAIDLPIGIPTSWGAVIASWDKTILELWPIIVTPILLAYTSKATGFMVQSEPPK
jgi:hypothetical protein